MTTATVNLTIMEQNVLLAQQGDQAAFGELIRNTQNTICSIALAIVRDIDASEDVAQKAYIAAWQQIGELKNPKSFLPWLRQITRNLAKNFLRDNKVQQRVSSEEAESLLEQYCEQAKQPDAQLEHEQMTEMVAELVSRLPVESRELVLLYYREQQSSVQVAKLLGLSESNVRKQLSRVRASMKQEILATCGKVLLSTVPAVTLTSAVLASLTMSSPVAAAGLASTMTSTKTSLLGKFAALLGGAAIGSLMGIAAVFISSKLLLKRIADEDAKRVVEVYRNYMIAWMLLSGMLLAASYELTEGWLAPVLAYLLFSFGLAKYMINIQKIVKQHVDNKAMTHWRQTLNKACYSLGTIMGFVVGFAGLIIGLMDSGRLII